jgi:thiamine biosynthesis protein ThiS
MESRRTLIPRFASALPSNHRLSAIELQQNRGIEAFLDAQFCHPYTSERLCERECVVQIRVNGEPRETEAGTTIARLLTELQMQPRYLAVERNFELVPRARHAECVLQEGDQLEIVTLVGGG